MLFTVALGVTQLMAQSSTKQQKRQAKANEVKQLVNNKEFVFVAQYANPMGGGHRYLNYDYDLKVKKDSLVAYLPYFGRVTFDPPVYPTQDGVIFTSTNFGYGVKSNKNGSWDVLLTPQDVKYDRQLRLTVQQNGSATLSVNIINRDPINFDGYIEKAKNK